MRLGLKDTFAWMKDINKPHLWHHTNVKKLPFILQENRLGFPFLYTSLTRRPDLDWAPVAGRPQIALKLDRDKLRNRYKIRPHEDYYFEGRSFPSPRRYEAEERILGPIEDLDKYLLEIVMPNDAVDYIKNLEEYLIWDVENLPYDRKGAINRLEDYRKNRQLYDDILKHPKLSRVDKGPWEIWDEMEIRRLGW